MTSARDLMKAAQLFADVAAKHAGQQPRGVIGLAAEFRSVLEDYTQHHPEDECCEEFDYVSADDLESIVDDLVRKAIANGATE